jgi:hypothetical protein
VEALFNGFSDVHLNNKFNKFKYNVSDSQWIDIDAIIFTMTLKYNAYQNLYILDSNNVDTLSFFL